MGLPWWSSGEDSVSNVGGLGSIPCKGTRSHMLQLRLRQAKQINFLKNLKNMKKHLQNIYILL